MKKAAALAVVGGDLRHGYLARLLRADGHEVSIFALERQACAPDVSIIHDPKTGFAQAQAIILPMPMLQDEKHLNAPLSNAPHLIETIFDNIPSGKLVLGGAVPPQARERAAICHLRLHDYLTREELAVANAVPTALAILPHRALRTLFFYCSASVWSCCTSSSSCDTPSRASCDRREFSRITCSTC